MHKASCVYNKFSCSQHLLRKRERERERSMVVALGPGKFYGSSLPRPRIYTDVKFNDDRIDPPAPVLDPLMSWAHEAHWSMGGLSFKRLRLQGRIEGNISKIRVQREKILKKRNQSHRIVDSGKGSAVKRSDSSPLPPPAPIAAKKRRFVALVDEEDDDDEEPGIDLDLKQADKSKNGGEEEIGDKKRWTRRLSRKLGDDFDRVAAESELGKSRGSPLKDSSDGGTDSVDGTSKSNSNGKQLKGGKKAKRVSENGASPSSPAGGSGMRSSPRLAKRRLS